MARRPRRLVHREISGTRRIVSSTPVPGTSIPYNDWRADTACGSLESVFTTTFNEKAITCPDCVGCVAPDATVRC